MMMSKVAPANAMATAMKANAARESSRVGDAEAGHRHHHQRSGQPQPAPPLAEASDERQAHVVDDRRPQELEVVGEERQREGRNCAAREAVLRKPRGQRRADHREGESR